MTVAINRDVFFSTVRGSLFGGRLSPEQVEGLDLLIDEYSRRRSSVDLRWFAYILATTQHETASTMQPIAEYGRGRGRPYGRPDPVTGKTYYGRGYVQLTWRENYVRMGRFLGEDLDRNPDLAMRPVVAAQIIFEGMIRGMFTGKGLADYIYGETADYRGARRIVNGTDRADLIAGYAVKYEAALRKAASTSAKPPAPVVREEPVEARVPPTTGGPTPAPTPVPRHVLVDLLWAFFTTLKKALRK